MNALVVNKSLRQDGYKKWNFFDFFLVFLLIFFASGVSGFARSFVTWESPLGVITVGTAAVALLFRERVRFGKKILFLLAAYWVLFIIQFVIFGSFHPKHMFYYPFYFLITYIYLRAFGDRLYRYMEDVLYYFAVIGLIFWFMDVVTAGNFRSALSGFQVLPAYDEIIGSYIFVYTIVLEGVESFIYRNSGFAWEPGAFAVFSCLGLYLNLARNKFEILSNKRAVIFILTILSTQSTTGYTILLVILLSKIWGSIHKSFKLLAAPVVLLLVVAVLNIPFMYEKINNLLDEDIGELADSASQSWNVDKPVAAQRFLSFKLDFDDFLVNPLTGYGGRDSEMGIKKQNLNVVTVSGVGRILAKFGLFGFIFFVASTYLSSIYFARKYNHGSKHLLFLIVIFIGVSYYMIDLPVMMVFWLAGFFSSDWETGSPKNGLKLELK